MQTPFPLLSFISSPPNVAIPALSLQVMFEATSMKPKHPNTVLELLAEQVTHLKWQDPGGFNLLEDDGGPPDTSGFTCPHALPQDPATTIATPSLAPSLYSIPVQPASSLQILPPGVKCVTIVLRSTLQDHRRFHLPTPRPTTAPSPESRKAAQPVGLGIQLRHVHVPPSGQRVAGDREAPYVIGRDARRLETKQRVTNHISTQYTRWVNAPVSMLQAVKFSRLCHCSADDGKWKAGFGWRELVLRRLYAYKAMHGLLGTMSRMSPWNANEKRGCSQRGSDVWD
ncbi:hypothetical protein BC830DRAFT_1214184 [Chytriomyces sp. MP71]|nr:hypothetical protein BC830DRAFT_1214184 [Chytriomyces sp. MP71]